MNITKEAVEALAVVLAREALVSADIDGYGWDAENDSPEPFMTRARERAQTYLEAASPHMLAAAWDQGWDAGLRFQPNKTNPYRTAR